MALDKLTVPALYAVNSTQPDSRQIEITIDLLFEGACFGKCLFPLKAIDVAAPDVQNIPIADEEGACGVGVIPESAASGAIIFRLMLCSGQRCRTSCLIFKKTRIFAVLKWI